MIRYTKLWILLKSKGMKKTDLLNVISSPTLTKLGKDENVTVESIGKICDYLNCQPGDIMENVNTAQTEEIIKSVAQQFDAIQQVMLDEAEKKGIKKEDAIRMISEAFPLYLQKLKDGENPIEDSINEYFEKNKK